MEILNSVDSLNEVNASIVTIGSFDGLHRGHQEIIKKVVSQADTQGLQSVVITFDPHPRHILDRGIKLSLLMSVKKKMSILNQLSVDTVLIIPFTQEFSRINAEEFMDNIVCKKFQPAHLVIGHDHHFGYKREGSPEYIKEYCANKNLTCEIVNAVSDDEIVFSSSHIRHLIEEGFVRRASFELGWVYGFTAKVVRGAGRGKGLSFPTANFIPAEKNQLIPKNGVYFCRGRINGIALYGMCNLGVRPTFEETDFVAEIHFFTQELNDLYDREIEIEFLERVRDEEKFNNAEQLIQQLKKDKEFCKQLMKKYI